MDKYFTDQPIVVTIPVSSDDVAAADVAFVGYSIVTVAPTESTLVSSESFTPGTDSNEVTVDLTDNPVLVPTIFQVNYTLSTNEADFSYTMNFMVSPAEGMIKGSNSYQGYFAAILESENLAGIDAFKSASRADQQAALKNAYAVINALSFADKYDEYYDLGALDETALDALEPAFLLALCKAQIVEANEMLDLNSVHYKRLDGLMSETIGESSMMFRPGNVNNYPISRRSMMFLRNYILIRAKLGRA